MADISQVTVAGEIRLPSNAAAPIKSIEFELLQSDWENGVYIARKRTPATVITGTAQFSISIWPNDAGDFADTKYRVHVLLEGGATVTPLPDLYIRKTMGPHDLNGLVIEQEELLGRYSNRVLTQQQHQALQSFDPWTIYLVEVTDA